MHATQASLNRAPVHAPRRVGVRLASLPTVHVKIQILKPRHIEMIKQPFAQHKPIGNRRQLAMTRPTQRIHTLGRELSPS
jgi:hypothetical protein